MNIHVVLLKYLRSVFLTLGFLLLSLWTMGQTVYVTNTGSKYHRNGCQYLSKSKISTSLDSALTLGYNACAVCKPSASTSTVQRVLNDETEPGSATTSVRCSSQTKSGNRYSRMTKERNGRCWQHQ